MPGDTKQKFGSNGQTITCSLASLANASSQQSTFIDNSANLFNEVLVFIKIRTGSSGTLSSGYVNVYVYASVDNGTSYTEGASGSNGSITLVNPTNLRWIGTVNAVANSTSYSGGPFPVSPAFGGLVPEKWGIVIENQTGGTLDSTESNHAKLYQGIHGQYT